MSLLNGSLSPGNTFSSGCEEPGAIASAVYLHEVFVACEYSDTLLGVNTLTNTLENVFQVGAFPLGVVYDPGNHEVYVSCWESDSVEALNASTGALVATVIVGYEPEGIAYDPANGYLYVADEESDNVGVIDGATNTLTLSIPVAEEPESATYDDANGDVYVTNYESENVSVISTSSNKVVASISPATFPDQITYVRGESEAYFSSFDSDEITMINTSLQVEKANISVGFEPGGLAADPVNGDLYVAQAEDFYIDAVSTRTNTLVATVDTDFPSEYVAYDNASGLVYYTDPEYDYIGYINPVLQSEGGEISLTLYPWEINYDPNNAQLYVSIEDSEYVLPISGTHTLLPPVGAGELPYQTLTDTLNGDLYISNFYSYNLTVVDGANDQTVGQVPLRPFSVDSDPLGEAFDPSNGDVYVSQPYNDTVEVVDTATNSVTSSIKVGESPQWLAYDAANGDIYVPNGDSDNVTVLNGATGLEVASVAVGEVPAVAQVDPGDGDVYVANWESDSVSVISENNNTVVATLPVGFLPEGMDYDPVNGDIFVGTAESDEVFVISGTTVLGEIPVGDGPRFVAYDPSDGYAYVANSESGSLSLIAPSSFIPSLVSVETTPSNSTLLIGESTNFTAYGSCGAYGCPSGVDFSWSTTNSLGALSGSSGTSVEFTAGDHEGTETVFVNGTLNGTTVESLPITITILPKLASVSATPLSATVAPGSFQLFDANAVCQGGPCPASAMFSWTLSNVSLGLLISGAGPSAVFYAGNATGSATIFLTAALHGITRIAPLIDVTVSRGNAAGTLVSVGISPSSATVYPGQTLTLLADPVCSGGSCPTTVGYTWTLEGGDGNLSATTGASIELAAGDSPGTVAITVSATLRGVVVESSPVNVTIIATPPIYGYLTPSTVTLAAGTSQSFTTTLICLAGPCVETGTYSWTMGSQLGTLSSTSLSSVVFHAGSSAGTTILTCAVSMGGRVLLLTANITVTGQVSSSGTSTSLPFDWTALIIAALVLAAVAVVLAIVVSGRRKGPKSLRPSTSASSAPWEEPPPSSTPPAVQPTNPWAPPPAVGQSPPPPPSP